MTFSCLSNDVAASTKHLCFVSHLPQIFDPHQPILAGECQRLVNALRLVHAEDSMFASIVNLDMFAVFDCQSLSAGENCMLKVILCADRASRSKIHGPPIGTLSRRMIANLALLAAVLVRRRRISDVGCQLCANRIKFGF